MLIVPSLHSFKLQFVDPFFASCPTIAIVFGTERGSPAVAETLREFLSKTAEADAISRTRAVCASVRTFTFKFSEPEPSGCCASKFVAGNPASWPKRYLLDM